MEMNHHEPASVVSRLYYIKDRAAAIKWDGTNYFYDFEAMDDMKAAGFPLKGNVEPYSEFVANHRQFLIFADPYEWLPLRLQEDGAKFKLIFAFSGARPTDAAAVAQASDPTLDESKGVPRITYPTPYVAGGSPYIAKHIFLVTMP
jgi:hypothetical protein